MITDGQCVFVFRGKILACGEVRTATVRSDTTVDLRLISVEAFLMQLREIHSRNQPRLGTMRKMEDSGREEEQKWHTPRTCRRTADTTDARTPPAADILGPLGIYPKADRYFRRVAKERVERAEATVAAKQAFTSPHFDFMSAG